LGLNDNWDKFSKFIDLLKQVKATSEADELLKQTCDIEYAFNSMQEINEFCNFVLNYPDNSIEQKNKSKEWGDIQTPLSFVREIYDLLRKWNFKPDIIIEPTMGTGNFLLLGAKYYPNLKSMYGVEIQTQYIWEALMKLIKQSFSKEKKQSSKPIIKIFNEDIFDHTFQLGLKKSKPNILIVGNPPWITVAELSRYQSKNIPAKNNIKKFTGLDALTGKSNFDITESIITKMLDAFSNFTGKIALLCKDTVIKNIIKEQPNKKYPITDITAFKFNTKQIFQKTCNASLFVASLAINKSSSDCAVSSFNSPDNVTKIFGWTNGKFVSDINLYEKNSVYEGNFPFQWRQGVKHDCASVLELTHKDGKLFNKKNQEVKVESEVVYPLLKGSNLRRYFVNSTNKRLILPQRNITDDTFKIELRYPSLWNYLVENEEQFQKRKSKIYKEGRFSIFGIGDYSFKPYKIAIAAMYKEPIFTLITPIDNKPVMLDDTCYFVGFDSFEEAIIASYLLNNDIVTGFLNSIVFKDSKRPYTKEILMRLDLREVAKALDPKKLLEIEEKLNLPKTSSLNFTKLCASIRKITEKSNKS
jgi:hypothetical protein